MFCVDTSGSTACQWGSGSRLHGMMAIVSEVIKQGSGKKMYGLVEFESQARIVCPVGTSEEELKDKLACLMSKGATAMFSAISLAVSNLTAKREELGEDIPLCIVLITDGDDNAGGFDVARQALIDSRTRLDVMAIGCNVDNRITELVNASGGALFFPKTVEDALQRVQSH